MHSKYYAELFLSSIVMSYRLVPHVSRECREVPISRINNANWDLLSYLSCEDTSWQLKISILLQRCITCLFFSFFISTFSSDTSNSCTFSVSSLDLRSLHHYLILHLLENNFATRIYTLLEKSTLIGQMKISHGIASRRHTLWLYYMTALVYHWMTRGKHIEHVNVPQCNFLLSNA